MLIQFQITTVEHFDGRKGDGESGSSGECKGHNSVDHAVVGDTGC